MLLLRGLPVVHVTAKISADVGSLVRPEVGDWLWPRLRRAFPTSLAGCLMPNHPHVLSPFVSLEAAVERLNRLLGHLQRWLGLPMRIGRASAVCLVGSRAEVRRQARYVGLNAPRAGLASCPLEWTWSTHRDVLGAVVDPWVSPAWLAEAFGWSPRDFAPRYHRFVSGDPSCHPDGTPLPVPAPPHASPNVPLERIAKAAAAATRASPDAIRRRGPTRALFIALARDQGWTSRHQLAARCGTSVGTIHRLARTPDPEALAAGRLCLGDRRLLFADPRPATARVLPVRAPSPRL